MIRRTLDSKFLSGVINHPEVLPWVSKGPCDVSALIADPHNYCLVTTHGGFIFHCLEAAVYEVHTQFLPDTPPTHVVQAGMAARRWMCTHTDVVEAYTRVQQENVRARRLTEALKWRHRFKSMGTDYYIMHYEDFVLNDNETQLWGADFHQKLDQAGVYEEHIDVIHDKWVGATMMTIKGFQAGKAIAFYNRWAKSTGYPPIKIVNQNPLIIDVGNCKIHVTESDFEVLSCP